MHHSKIVLSVDDGSADHYRLFEELARRDLCATFNIVTNRIGGQRQLTVAQLQEICAHPAMEIACHGHAHQNDKEDILAGKALLKEWLRLSDDPIGFASPGSQMKRSFVEENEDFLTELGLLYVRSAENPSLCPRHKALREQYADAPKFIHHNLPQLIFDLNSRFVPSAVILHDTRLEDVLALIDIAIRERAGLVLMFHRVKKAGEYNYEELYNFDFEKTLTLLDHLAAARKEGKLEVVTTKELFCGIRQK